MALFMAALEQTIVAPALPSIGQQFGNPVLLPWVATAYLLAVTVASPIFGTLADTMGRQRAVYLALGLFLAGAFGSAVVESMQMLVATRAVQGIGGGGLVSLPFVIVADTVPIHYRPRYGALISTLFAVASIGGPPIGGILTEFLHWRFIFWLNLPIGFLALAMLLMQPPQSHPLERRSLDVMGALMLVCAVSSAIVLVDGLTAGRGKATLLAGLAITAVVAGGGLVWRLRTAPDPLVPMRVLAEPTVRLCAVGFVGLHGTNIGFSLYLPFYYQHVLDMAPAEAGVAVLGFLGGIAFGSYVPALMLARNPRYKGLMVGFAAVALCGAVSMIVVLAAGGGLIAVELASVVMGLGLGGLYPTLMVVAQNASGKADMGATTGVVSFSRAVGGVCGVALMGMIAGAIGLTTGTIDGLPIWMLAAVPTGLTMLCLIAMSLLPARALGDR